ncbi:hypothetical protein FDECE_6902 [Fusarium decemcellulare]|nr:hypothetical protein FDECE_6902 [Fusarium decemcellulare]
MMDKSEKNIREYDIIQYAQKCKGLFAELEGRIDSSKKDLYGSVLESSKKFQKWVLVISSLTDSVGPLAQLSNKYPGILGSMVQLLGMIERNLGRNNGATSWWKMLSLGFRSDLGKPVIEACSDAIEVSLDRLKYLMEAVPLNKSQKPQQEATVPPSTGSTSTEDFLNTGGNRLLRIKGLIRSKYPKASRSLVLRLAKSVEQRAIRLADQDIPNLNQETRQSLLNLLEPYVCPLEECGASPPTFTSLQSFLEHMGSVHDHQTQWVLMLQHTVRWFCDIDVPKPCIETFPTSGQLEAHVAESHKDKMIPSLEIASMLQRNMLASRLDPRVCPLCYQDADKKVINDNGMSDPPRTLGLLEDSELVWLASLGIHELGVLPTLKHICQHMENLSLLSLSVPGIIKDADEDTQSSEQAHTDQATPNTPISAASGRAQLSDRNHFSDLSEWSGVSAKIRDDKESELVKDTETTETTKQHQPQAMDDQPPVPTEHIKDENPRRMLRALMFQSRKESPFDARRFFSHNCLELITRESIQAVMTNSDSKTIDFVEKQAKVCFAILISMRVDEELAIETFRLSNLTDRCLPISKETVYDNCEVDKSDRECGHIPELNAFHNEPWDLLTTSDFYERQWEFLVPTFSLDDFEYHLDAKAVLPITRIDPNRKSGLFSDVTKIGFAQSQMDAFRPMIGSSEWIALKELRTNASALQGDDLGARHLFEREVHTMKILRSFRHPHILSSIAAIWRDEWGCILFPWAEGGNLRDLLVNQSAHQKLTDAIIRHTIKQILGLCNGLAVLHKENLRHGDVKPENILRFTDRASEHIGTLKLGDFGLSKQHHVPTRDRGSLTDTRFGTIRYEAPEVAVDQNVHPLSRLYDIWSMGCVMVEIIIWLFYGSEGLGSFHKSLETRGGKFYVLHETHGNPEEVSVNPVVENWVSHLSEHEPECVAGRALGDLLQVAYGRMLVPRLSSMARIEDPSDFPVRATSDEVVVALEEISNTSESNASYVVPKLDPVLRHHRQLPPSSLINKVKLDPVPTQPFKLVQEYRNLQDQWQFIVDNSFAENFRRSSPDIQSLTAVEASNLTNLCDDCHAIDLLDKEFTQSFVVRELEGRANRCDLCRLFYKAYVRSNLPTEITGIISFVRTDSTIRIGRRGPVALSIFSDLGAWIVLLISVRLETTAYHLATSIVATGKESIQDIQAGLLVLPFRGTPPHTAVMRHWIRSCDEKHACMEGRANYIPTRLLHIATSQIRVLETTAGLSGPYTVLSCAWGHSWRSTGEYGMLLPENLDQLARGVDVEALPRSIRDAIAVTRQLKIDYLWVDSLCILQGSEGHGDWMHEAANYEHIISNAYCVLAASSALGFETGFLSLPEQREVISLRTKTQKELFVCNHIDDFERDVEQSVLSSRAWVLQERIFSRRTIFFTSMQMYWQCGESLSARADILGSTNFPKSFLERSKMGPIQLFQQLYAYYSGLLITRSEDRPHAIAAPEARLLYAFKTRGGYGVFEKYLGRSLVWRRAGEKGLTRIWVRPDFEVPTWSWMAYVEQIQYLDLPFDQVDWNPNVRLNDDGPVLPLPYRANVDCPRTLAAEAWEYDKLKITEAVYDDPSKANIEGQRCVVIGQSRKISPQALQAHYLLLVIEGPARNGWERLGVALAEGEHNDMFFNPLHVIIW